MKPGTLRSMLAMIAVVTAPVALAISPNEFDAYETASTLSWATFDPSASNPAVTSCAATGTDCLENVSSATGPAPTEQIVFNENQWSGNYFEIGVTGIEMWLHNKGTTVLMMRIGISNDPDGANSGADGTCYISATPVTLPAGASRQVRFGLTASKLGLVMNGDRCGKTASLKAVLSDVTHLRLYSAATPQWQADTISSTLQVDNLRVLKDSATQWHWIGIKFNNSDNCPTLGGAAGDWMEGHLFGDVNDADATSAVNAALSNSLRRFCDFRLPPGIEATPAQTQLITNQVGESLLVARPDLLGVTTADRSAGRKDLPTFVDEQAARGGAAGVEATLYESLAERFRVYAGKPDLDPLPNTPPYPQTSTIQTRLVVIDTQPNSFDEPNRVGQTSSLHGITMMRIASWLTCDPDARPAVLPDFANCVAEVLGRVAMSYRCLDDVTLTNPGGAAASCRRPTEGGYTGSIADLARATWEVVRNWKDNASAGPLVINGSLRWDVLYGGDEALVDDMPPVVQAAHAALADARCRGALPIFAAGNRVNGPVNYVGPSLPGLWETRAAPSFSQCNTALAPHDTPDSADFPANPNVYFPLVYAVGGVQPDDDPLANAMPGGEPRIVAIADHATIPPLAGFASNDAQAKFGTFTGASVATAVVSATAAAAWHYRSDLAAWEIMNALHASGEFLNRTADFHAPVGAATGVRRIRLCRVINALCSVPGTASCPATVPACPLEKTPAELSPDAVETALCVNGACLIPPAYDLGNHTICSSTDAMCPGETLCYPPGEEPDDELKCPHLNFFSSTSRTATNPAPEDQPCPMCTSSAHSPGILHGEIDVGYGGHFDGAANAIQEPTAVLRAMTLRCDGFNYPVPQTAINPVGGARFTLRNVPSHCADADEVSLEFALDDPANTADAPYDEWLSVSSPVLQLSDADNDDTLDFEDNCTETANAGQQDTDNDGIGNRCDGDIAVPNDCQVNALDLGTLKAAFFGSPGQGNWNPDADFNSDDVINAVDLGLLKSFFFGVPGPSALPNACSGAP